MNSTPGIETHEISDADLDNVSGGVLGGLGNTVGSVVSTVDAVAPVSGVVATVTSTVAPVVNVDTSGVSGTLNSL
ncbi:type A2 lantipeptide [Streptomyces sp. NPDC050560]|uniref:type A2 lantipeptide n=1 Tax=Streptomyces sp. NPDC050560 TaxID=3365630 RepID=UPI00378EA703